jgi:hypothetical protein
VTSLGADALGIAVAWVNSGNRSSPTAAQIENEVTELRELLRSLARVDQLNLSHRYQQRRPWRPLNDRLSDTTATSGTAAS